MRQAKTSENDRHREAMTLASRRFATAMQTQLALARVQILDSKRALHQASVELDRARSFGVGVGAATPPPAPTPRE